MEEADADADAPVRSAPHLGQDVGQGLDTLPAVATTLLGVPIGVLTPLAKTDIFYLFQAKSFAAAGAFTTSGPEVNHSALIS